MLMLSFSAWRSTTWSRCSPVAARRHVRFGMLPQDSVGLENHRVLRATSTSVGTPSLYLVSAWWMRATWTSLSIPRYTRTSYDSCPLNRRPGSPSGVYRWRPLHEFSAVGRIRKKYQPLTVVLLDAHLDYRDKSMDSR